MSPCKEKIDKVNLAEKLDSLNEYWSPSIVGELNGQHVKLAKIKGEFVWHSHENEDEMFLFVKGALRIELRDDEIVLNQGQFCVIPICVIPRGVEHKPMADEEAHIMLFEPKST